MAEASGESGSRLEAFGSPPPLTLHGSAIMNRLMAETPDLPDAPDPDLDEPRRADPRQPGVGRRHSEVTTTSRRPSGSNCIALAARAGGEQYVTRSMVEAHPYVTWRDYNYWIIELLEYQKGRDYYWDMLLVFSGKFDLPETYVDRLGLRHLERPTQEALPSAD